MICAVNQPMISSPVHEVRVTGLSSRRPDTAKVLAWESFYKLGNFATGEVTPARLVACLGNGDGADAAAAVAVPRGARRRGDLYGISGDRAPAMPSRVRRHEDRVVNRAG